MCLLYLANSTQIAIVIHIPATVFGHIMCYDSMLYDGYDVLVTNGMKMDSFLFLALYSRFGY